MQIKWRVYWKASENSPWRFTGVIESDKQKANEFWASHIAKIKYHSFKIEPCAYGVAINR
jgi:hypothetical protein